MGGTNRRRLLWWPRRQRAAQGRLYRATRTTVCSQPRVLIVRAQVICGRRWKAGNNWWLSIQSELLVQGTAGQGAFRVLASAA